MKEDKGWSRREIRNLLVRCAWGFSVAAGMNFFFFDNKKPEFVFMAGSWFCAVFLLESLHRAWRRRRHGTSRPLGAKGDQTNGEDDV
nr:hypothetical protein [uncultured Roseateles sp.]